MYITRDIIWLGKRYHLHVGRTVIMGLVMSCAMTAWMFSLAVFLGNSEIYALILCLGCTISIFFLRKAENNVVHRNSVSLKEEIRLDLMKTLYGMGPALYSEERTGNLSNMIWMKVDWLEYYFDEYLPESIGMCLFHAVTSVLLCWKFGWVGICYFISMALVLLVPNLFHKRAMYRGKEEWDAEMSYTSDSLDRIHGMSTLKLLGQTGIQKNYMETSAQKWFLAVMRNLRLTTAENQCMSFFIQCAKYILIAASGTFLGRSAVWQKEILLWTFIAIAITDNAYQILGAWIKGAKGISGVDEIIKFLKEGERKKKFYPAEDKTSYTELDEVCMQEVSFSYETEEVLSDFSLKLSKKRHVALVGASGCGKSTVAYLLCEFYQPNRGEIVCTSVGVERKFRNRRQYVTAVWQDSRVFLDTALENIRMGNPSATREEIIHVAKAANIHDKIVSLPQGYDTFIGDGKEGLSGGEKQRIIIARAMLKNTPMIMLDEATAYLDTQNEREIRESINRLTKDKIVLTIAHRLETVKNADWVYFMRKGKIIAQGTHEELKKNSAEYRRHFGLEVT
ncbi:MAG: ABC transporter ATP-binding protein/permease [Acetatifactor sp.]|nr:ABC transporter ATP-binding protein/permease [Acetatifactor sp.]